MVRKMTTMNPGAFQSLTEPASPDPQLFPHVTVGDDPHRVGES